MNYLNTTAIAVFGFVFAGSMNTAYAAEVNVNLDDNVNNPGAHIQIQGTDKTAYNLDNIGNDSNLLIVFYVQIMPDDFVMQLHRF